VRGTRAIGDNAALAFVAAVQRPMCKWMTVVFAGALAACATVPEPAMSPQPGLAAVAAPYAGALHGVGVERVVSPGRGAMVRLDTHYGAVYVRYPGGVPPLAFEVDLGDARITARAPSFEAAAYQRLFDALVPEAVRRTAENNAFEWARANPVN
jgi:hypothetical protein